MSFERERICLFDTTLRDGAQTQGVDFTVEDKREIARLLDTLGVDYVEGGWPGANAVDNAFFAEPPKLRRARFTAFGMTRRSGASAANDPGLAAILNTDAAAACLVGKTWDFQVDVALGIPREENLALIADSLRAVVARGKEALFDAEHFFDGFKANPSYAMRCLTAALEAGARWVVLCDTNGGTLPEEVESIIREVVKEIPGVRLGIHAHNDTENAVANSLAAVRAGARQIQGTINGLGERTGNANLITLIANLALKPVYAERYETGVSTEGVRSLTKVAHALDKILNRLPRRRQPYVGGAAFAHKGGLHASAVLKDPRTYEHVDPALVGNRRQILVSGQAGRSNVIAQLNELGIPVPEDKARLDRLVRLIKEKDSERFSYEDADASFEVLARRALGELPDFFQVTGYRVSIERRPAPGGGWQVVAEATVKVQVDGEARMSVAEGNGPVNALDQALRKDLGKYSMNLRDLELTDFKVRILNQGTEAVTRVTIESADRTTGRRWSTVGVSANVVDAAFQALLDSVLFKLLRDKLDANAAPAVA